MAFHADKGRILRHVYELKSARLSFEPQWRDVATFLLPYRHRTTLSDHNRGDRRNHEILDATATMAYRTFRAGMMAGNTSPARSWFRLLPEDPDLVEAAGVREWLDDTRRILETWFARSNLYNSLPILYGDAGGFGTGVMSLEEDDETLLLSRTYPVGSWWIARDWKGRPNVWYREFRMTVRQIADRFGLDGASTFLRNLYDNAYYETYVDIGHYIGPNDADVYDDGALSGPVRFPWRSCYFELGTSERGGTTQAPYFAARELEDRVLHESGFEYFPVLVFAWERTGEDVYGIECPGMTAIGDIKQLQRGERKILQAVDKMIDPPVIAPPWAKREGEIATLPGKVNYVAERDATQGIRPLYQLAFDVAAMEEKQEAVRRRIREAFYTDLFRMFAAIEHEPGSRTATEILERKEEKLVQLGPVVEALNYEVLNPLIDIAFAFAIRQGKLPPAPPDLEGQNIKVEYVSLMAQAQRAVGLGAIERTVSFVSSLAGAIPETADKIDWDQAVDEYAERAGAPPRIVRSDEVVEAIRASRRQASAVQAQLAALAEGAKTAQTLSKTDTGSKNALTDLMGAIAPAIEEATAT